jgi:hypothetical protein
MGQIKRTLIVANERPFLYPGLGQSQPAPQPGVP